MIAAMMILYSRFSVFVIITIFLYLQYISKEVTFAYLRKEVFLELSFKQFYFNLFELK